MFSSALFHQTPLISILPLRRSSISPAYESKQWFCLQCKIPVLCCVQVSWKWCIHEKMLISSATLVGIATRYGLEGPDFEPQWRVRFFLTCPDRRRGPSILLHNGYRVSLPEVKRQGRGANHPLPSSAFKACYRMDFTFYRLLYYPKRLRFGHPTKCT